MKKKTKRLISFIFIFLAILYIFGGGIASWLICSSNFKRVEIPDPVWFNPYYVYPMVDYDKYPRTEFTFLSGDNTLVGYDYGKENTRGLVIICSGMGGTGDDYMEFAIRFIDDGYRVITFNYTGVGSSEGKSMRGLYQSEIDLDTLLTYIEDQNEYDNLPIYLIGHSWGGFAVCSAMNYQHRVNAVVSMAGFNDGAELFTEQGVQMAGDGFYLFYPQFWVIQKVQFGSVMDKTAVDGINNTNIPFLIIQGKEDNLITPDKLAIYAHKDEITNPNVQYVLNDGDHEGVFKSTDAFMYQEKMNEKFKEFFNREEVKAQIEADKNATINLRVQWANEVGFDQMLYNQVDDRLFKQIEAFFDEAK